MPVRRARGALRRRGWLGRWRQARTSAQSVVVGAQPVDGVAAGELRRAQALDEVAALDPTGILHRGEHAVDGGEPSGHTLSGGGPAGEHAVTSEQCLGRRRGRAEWPTPVARSAGTSARGRRRRPAGGRRADLAGASGAKWPRLDGAAAACRDRSAASESLVSAPAQTRSHRARVDDVCGVAGERRVNATGEQRDTVAEEVEQRCVHVGGVVDDRVTVAAASLTGRPGRSPTHPSPRGRAPAPNQITSPEPVSSSSQAGW